MNWRGLTAAGVLIAAGLAWLMLRHRPSDLGPGQSPEPPQPGYYMTDARITETGPDGLPVYRMSAKRIQQNGVDQSIRLEGLQFVYSDRDGDNPRVNRPNDWILTADTGLIKSLDAKTIDLQDNVRIVGGLKPDSTRTPAVIRTSRLRVDAAAHTAATRERVDIEWDNCRLNGRGLKADLKRQTLRLESKVHGNCN